MADLSTDSTSPTAVATTDPNDDGTGKSNLVRFSARVKSFVDSMSPVGVTAYDSGWVNLTPAAGTAGGRFGIRRVGAMVFMRGQVTPATNWGAAGASTTVVAAGGIPAQFCPVTAQSFVCGSSVATTTFRVVLGSDGSLVVQPSTATATAAVWFGNVVMPVG